MPLKQIAQIATEPLKFPEPNSIVANGPREDKAYNVKAIISSVFGEDFGKNVHKRTHILTDPEDSYNIMVAVLLKYTTEEIKVFVNKERRKRGLDEIKLDKRDIYNFKSVYANAIDRAYVDVSTYIGDIHPYADKLHRIGLYNDIIEKLAPVRFQLDYPDEMILKKASLLLKAMDRMNDEMGKVSMDQFVHPRQRKADEDEDKLVEGGLSKAQIEEEIKKKFAGQLPVSDVTVISTNGKTENNGQ